MNNIMVKVEREGVVKHESFKVLSPDEVRERAALNAANTATAIHKRVVAELNGK